MTDREVVREIARAVLRETPSSYQMNLAMRAWERCRQQRFESEMAEMAKHYEQEITLAEGLRIG